MSKFGIIVRAIPERLWTPEGEEEQLVVSLVLQPDLDTPDGRVEPLHWPSTIFDYVRSGRISIEFANGTSHSVEATPRQWVRHPGGAQADKRDQLWQKAIGKSRLNSLRNASSGFAASQKAESISHIFASPVRTLARTLKAFTAVASVMELQVLAAKGEGDLDQIANPLARSTLQSDALFSLFPKSRPSTPRVDEEQAGNDELAPEAVRRIRNFGLQKAGPRFAPFESPSPPEEDFTTNRAGPGATSDVSVGIISNAMARVIGARMHASKPGLLYNETRLKQLPEEAPAATFYAQAERALMPNEENILSTVNDQGLFSNALADYFLGMIPDSEQQAARAERSTNALSDQPSDEALALLRSIGGMMAYPQLASFFGLIVDVTIPSSSIPLLNGYMSAALIAPGETEVSRRVWTRVRTAPGTVPIILSNSTGTLNVHADGMLVLGGGRYSVESLDTNAAIEGMLNAARSDEEARRAGATTEELSSGVPTQRGTGLAIIDSLAREMAAEEVDAAAKDRNTETINGEQATVAYLEDLLMGYRLDVLTDIPGVDGWRTLMARNVTFREVDALLEQEGSDAVASMHRNPEWGGERLEGVVRSMHREVEKEKDDGAEEKQAVVFETLATWRNWSLAVPAGSSVVELTAESDLKLAMQIEPASPDDPYVDGDPEYRLLPPMRFGRTVAFHARSTMSNGASLAPQEAPSDTSGPFVLDGGRVLRHEPIATPRVFQRGILPFDKTLAANRDIVVKTDGEKKIQVKADNRLVLPGEVSFETVELEGALDRFDELPEPPFSDLELTPPLGRPPVDPLSIAASGAAPTTTDDSEIGYPDPMAHRMVLAFTEHGIPAESKGFPTPRIVKLYRDEPSRNWPKVAGVSIELEAVAARSVELGLAAAVDETRYDGAGIAHVPIRLEPAEEIDLTIWSLPQTIGEFGKSAVFVEMMNYALTMKNTEVGASATRAFLPSLQVDDYKTRLLDAFPDDENVEDIVRAFMRLPIPALSHHETLKLVHAVERPLEVPKFINLWAVHAPEAIPASGETVEDALRRAWNDRLGSWGIIPGVEAMTDALLADMKILTPRSSRVFFGGSLTFHRKSTNRVDLLGTWKEYREDIFAQRDASGDYRYVPESQAQMLGTIEGITYRHPKADRSAPDELGLAVDEFEHPRNINFSFRDTRAREVTINVKALSRFKAHFTPDDDATEPEGDRFSVVSETPVDGTTRLIIASTVRPKPLPELACAPSLHYKTQCYVDKSTSTAGRHHRRTVKMRLDLGTSFYDTGFQERVGIVCWPPDLFERSIDDPIFRETKVSDIDRQVVSGGPQVLDAEAAGFVTRWGRDPIHDSGDLPALIPSDAFRQCKKTVPGVRMPLPSKEPATPQGAVPKQKFLKVALALYDPLVDPDTGRFYVDIEIDQNFTYEPWIRLGLVRYQEHSLHDPDLDLDLRCSLPQVQVVRIPADREVNVEIDRGRMVSLRYAGVGYADAYLPRAVRVAKDRVPPLHSSTVDITLLRQSGVAGTSGVPILLEGIDDRRDGLAHIRQLRPRVSDGHSEWVIGNFADSPRPTQDAPAKLLLPLHVDTSSVTILIEEYEHYAADDPEKNFGPPTRLPKEFVEPLTWIDSVPLGDRNKTIISSRLVSAVALTFAGPASEEIPSK